MHQKSKTEAKRSKIFGKLAREITVAAKQGLPDAAHNPRLRAAIADARKNNLPRDRIDRAIKSALPGATDGGNYDEVRYEGYGPGGTALIVEALTDNRNRTAAELRTIFSKHGGTMGETGSVAFMFSRLGEISFPLSVGTADDMLEAVIEAGGNDVESDTTTHVVTCSIEDFGQVRDALEKKFGEAETAKLAWRPNVWAPAAGETAQMVMKLIDALDDNDDVQHVIGNAEISDEDIETFNAS
jgi:YebC/PmpR family DNA-binding regulatory protein